MGAPFREALVRGSLERPSSIMMPVTSAGLALILLAIGGGKPGNELQTPMAIVILGGCCREWRTRRMATLTAQSVLPSPLLNEELLATK